MQLKHLTDKSLLIDTKALVRQERKLTTEILWYLKEIDSRKLYADLKYSSMFVFCAKELGYSDSAAFRRIKAARALQAMPELQEKIKEGALNLSLIGMVEQQIKEPEDKKEIYKQIENKTTKEAQNIILQKAGNETVPEKEKTKQVSKTQHELKLTIDDETLALINELKDLKPNKSLKDILKSALKTESEKTKKQKFAQTTRPTTSCEAEVKSRTPSASIKRKVYKRDQGKCQNCGTTHALEFDHKQPWSLGGKTSTQNLRLLCRNCNQRAAMTVKTLDGHPLDSDHVIVAKVTQQGWYPSVF